jgi:hypothetical protein
MIQCRDCRYWKRGLRRDYCGLAVENIGTGYGWDGTLDTLATDGCMRGEARGEMRVQKHLVGIYSADELESKNGVDQ